MSPGVGSRLSASQADAAGGGDDGPVKTDEQIKAMRQVEVPNFVAGGGGLYPWKLTGLRSHSFCRVFAECSGC